MYNFDNIPPNQHKAICIKFIKEWLKHYYKFQVTDSPQSSILRPQTNTLETTYPNTSFCDKLDIDRAIEELPLKLRKIVYMHFIIGYSVAKVCTMLGFKFRVNFYRKLDEAYELMYESLGYTWLKSNVEED